MNLQDTFNNEIAPKLMNDLGIKNIMAVPRLKKVVINMGVGEAAIDKKYLESAKSDLTAIAGQQAIITYARKSVASFKIREGWPMAAKLLFEAKECMTS